MGHLSRNAGVLTGRCIVSPSDPPTRVDIRLLKRAVRSDSSADAQMLRGALQDLDHIGMLRGITRFTRTVRVAVPTSIRVHWAALASVRHSALARRWRGPVTSWPCSRVTVRSASTRWKSIPPHATAYPCSSWSRTTAPGRSRCTTRHRLTARWSGRNCSAQTTRPWPGRSGRMASAWTALLDVLVSGEPLSSDAKSGLAWVRDLQPLAAWDESERCWRAGLPSK